ncbi:hypothetical protein Pyn_18456 [Prunus yedoensis var. nudiflora]|uniref:Uncharacterized protein n=1 Tax=Prunus yedoensis var. nudiflora TaxID=2094558 RepID=A0A314ZI41_PRUYE|nr:hypothetical protein Pyn_18456 [Prunus yedoensis var. nudiflora]
MSPSNYDKDKRVGHVFKECSFIYQAAKQAREKPYGTWLKATNDFITTRASSPKRSNGGVMSIHDGDEGNGTQDRNIQRIFCTNDIRGSKGDGGPRVNGGRPFMRGDPIDTKKFTKK